MFLRHEFGRSVMVEKEHRILPSLPKADMHVHISLALTNGVFIRRVEKRRTPLPADFIIKNYGSSVFRKLSRLYKKDHNNRYYKNLSEFHATYEKCRDMTRTPQELANTVYAYLEHIAKEGAIYAEISNSFRAGKEFEAQMEAISEGIKKAKENTGIEARIVVTTLRNHGTEKAEEATKTLTKLKDKYPLITGFGLVGDEGVNPFSDFTRSLHMAWHEAGLGLTPHVAEQQLPNAVDFLTSIPKEALEVKSNDRRRLRVGHGVLIHMSDELMHQFRDLGICMELCLSANKRIGLPKETKRLQNGNIITSTNGELSVTVNRSAYPYYNNIEVHPIMELMAYGIPICLGSDNPLLMNTNIGKEHSLAHMAGLESTEQQLLLTRNAIIFANIEPEIREQLLRYIDSYNPLSDPYTTALGYKHPRVN